MSAEGYDAGDSGKQPEVTGDAVPEVAAAAGRPQWTLSLVSHGHLPSVRCLLTQLREFYWPGRFEVVLTINDTADHRAGVDLPALWPGPLHIIRNTRPRGFAANQNAAFARARGRLFAIIDADLEFGGDPFPALADVLENPQFDGVIAPSIVDERGRPQDNGRELLTPAALLRRYAAPRRPLRVDRLTPVDWVAGLFLAMRAETFWALGGMDEGYFLYCEDVDLSVRAWNAGMRVALVPTPPVIHRARRMSRRHPRFLLWHCQSIVRLWRSPGYGEFLARRAGRSKSAAGTVEL